MPLEKQHKDDEAVPMILQQQKMLSLFRKNLLFRPQSAPAYITDNL